MGNWQILNEYLQRLTAWGFLGLLIENIFTGFKAIFNGRWDAPTKSNLPVFFVYGVGGIILEVLDDRIGWGIWLKAIPFVITIFAIEFLFGLLFKKIYGRCFWKYTKSDTNEEIHRFSIMGLIRLDYMVPWYILSIFFIYASPRLKIVINTLSRL